MSENGNGSAFAHRIYLGDNLDVLRRELADATVDLVYIDPPFNTGRTQRRTRLRTARDPQGDRTGFGGRRYATTPGATTAFADTFDDYLAFLTPRLEEAHRVLAPHGTLYVHLDPREAHYVKVRLDAIFGRASFLNEIVWAYDYGGRSFARWPAKHDTILVYVKTPGRYTFNVDAVERLPYLAPQLVDPSKAARGKFPTDVWWHTIVPTASRERTGYATQKPLGIVRRIVQASSHPGDLVLDFFAGSGTTGAACMDLGRRSVLVDNNRVAWDVMRRRFLDRSDIEWIGPPAATTAHSAESGKPHCRASGLSPGRSRAAIPSGGRK